jgi:hypothetical protein
MRKLASKNIKGQNVEIFELTEKSINNCDKGPLYRNSISFRWYVNGVYVESFSWHTKKVRQEMLINQFVDTHKTLFN